jgi:DNA-binding NarL/FixJ family response regulator
MLLLSATISFYLYQLMAKLIRVVIVEDIEDIRESLQTLISGKPGYNCAGSYATAEAAIADIPIIKPDVVLMDINLPGMNGVEAVRQLKEHFPDINFLMCTVFDDDENIFLALRAGAGGYILKNNSPWKILEAIKEINDGGAPMSATIAKRVINTFQQIKGVIPKHTVLSEREMEVLQLLSSGLLYKEAANKLSLSVETIRSHCRKIYEKLHVNTKLEAINMVFHRK